MAEQILTAEDIEAGAELPSYKEGDRLRFIYPTEYDQEPGSCGYDDGYVQHSGQVVTIVRPRSWHDEYENLGDPMYRVRADDGWEGDVWESEMEI